MSLACSM